MKYQYILNDKIVYQTDSASEFFVFLNKPENTQERNSILYNLLEKSGGYTCNMATA